jgi:ADP-ribose pyrophosphatase
VSDDEPTLLETHRFRVVQVGREPGPAGRPKAVIRHPGSVCILPLLSGDRVCLIRNYRPAAGRALIELPAGTLEPGEPPAEAAARELAEETGYRAESWQLLREFYLAPGLLDERAYLFAASELTAGPPRREADEQIENLIVTRSEALQLVHRGQIEDAKTIVALLSWQRP